MSDSSNFSFSRSLNPAKTSPAVLTWLIVCCAMVFLMVVVGGLTRLTQSGLSMVDWEPVRGMIPPIGEAAWLEEFARYQQSPEYRQVNQGMSLEAFKRIFFWEYGHRMLGRLIGLVYFVPLVFFVLTRRIAARRLPGMVLVFVLGGLQGLLGWYMVKSGLVDDPHVSQYRLTSHLALAVLLYSVLLWMTLSVARGRSVFGSVNRGGPVTFSAMLCVLIGLMIVTGGFMAGTHAGHVHNTFPTIDGSWLPANTLAMQPWWLNFFENVTTIQVIHRYLAVITLAAITLFVMLNWRRSLAAWFMLFAAIIQFALGVVTLLGKAQLPMAAIHQMWALVLLTFGIATLHRLRVGR